MNPIKVIFNWFLNRSKSYTFYKNNYNYLIKQHKTDSLMIQQLNRQLNKMKIDNNVSNKEIQYLKEINVDYKNQIEFISSVYEKNNSYYYNEITSQNNTLIKGILDLYENSKTINDNFKRYNELYTDTLNKSTSLISDKLEFNNSKAKIINKNLKKSINKQLKSNENNLNNLISTTNKNITDTLHSSTIEINTIQNENKNILQNITQQTTNNNKTLNENKNILQNITQQTTNNNKTLNEKINTIQNENKNILQNITQQTTNNKSFEETINRNAKDINLIKENINKNNENLLKYLDKNLDLDKVDIFNHISEELHNNNFTNLNAYKEINKMKLFDEKYYKNEYNFISDIDPLLHYIYKGYKEDKNPSPIFDNTFYKNSNETIAQSNLNPLVYFVSKGFKEGNMRFNPKVMDVKHINKYELDEKIAKFNDLGVKKRKRKTQLIVSLTSYPERMYDIHYCLYSLLNQEVKPDKVILWLAEEEFPGYELDIPKEVLKLKENGLTIKFCENIKSYKKCIPTLRDYPDDILVTADDDIYYPEDWLKNLYEEHLKHPKCVIGLRSRRMELNDDDEFIDYEQWKLSYDEKEESYLNFMTGAGGILYPPHCFYKDVLKKEIFLEISDIGDDLWLWAMAIMNKTKYKVPSKTYVELIYINPARERLLINESTLWSLNINENQNNKQIKAIINKYPEIIDIIKDEKNEIQ